ncbi:MAG: HTH domain-containing protein [Gammaproteobacteria bacterium]|nr:HTH domain-containing protein [Gammaproteobacteria bacterium]
MRRADRLFQIVGLLKQNQFTTARDLSDALEVSERTIYRYIQDLSLSGIPIEAETGSGYRLMKGFHLPLMKSS